jgi:hypothetical protein
MLLIRLGVNIWNERNEVWRSGGVFVVGLTCHVMMTVWFMVMITSPGCAVC